MFKVTEEQKRKIDLISEILKAMRDDELIDDLYNQLRSHYATFRGLQNKHIETVMFEVDNFFEGIEDDKELLKKFGEKKNP